MFDALGADLCVQFVEDNYCPSPPEKLVRKVARNRSEPLSRRKYYYGVVDAEVGSFAKTSRH